MLEAKGTSVLAALIEEQMGICDEMITLAEREQQALSRFRPAHLPEILAAQDDCANRLAASQDAMDAPERDLAAGLGLTTEVDPTPDVSILLPHLPLDARARLGALRSALEERAYTLAVLNAQNALLVRTGLLQIDQTASVLASVLGEPRAYGAAGNMRMPTANNTLLLNRRV